MTEFQVLLETGKLKLGSSIAIVGNSRNILNKEYGEEIDSHDEVIRFNYAITENIEKHVGKKQTYRFGIMHCVTGASYNSHPTGIVNDYKLYKKFTDTNIFILHFKVTDQEVYITNIAKKHGMYNPSNKYFGITVNMEYFNNAIKSLGIPISMRKQPQIGLCVILTLCHLGYKPDIYGFDLSFCETNVGYPWTDVKHKCLSSCHEHAKEHLILKYLIDKELVIYRN